MSFNNVIESRRIAVAFCGPSRCGKDTAARIVAAHTDLRFRGSLSWYLAPYVAAHQGTTRGEAWCYRHKHPEIWTEMGDRVRSGDPLALVRDCLEEADIVAGCRSMRELEAMRASGWISLFVWVDRDVPPDPTIEYGPEACDATVSNRGTRDELEARLRRLFANFAAIDWES